MQNPVFYGAFLAIIWIKPRSVVTNYSECMRSNGAYRDAYVTRSQTQSLVCLWFVDTLNEFRIIYIGLNRYDGVIAAKTSNKTKLLQK